MGNIVYVQTINEDNPYDLTNSVYKLVVEWQREGYYVEVQYGGGFSWRGGYHRDYSAMVIARLK